MKELLELILKHTSGYLPVLFAMFGRPKTTIATKVTGKNADLDNALLFIGISIAIGFALQAPLIPKGDDLMVTVGSTLVAKIVFILMFAGVIWVVMRLFGGHGSFEANLSAYLYVSGPLYLLLVLINILSLGLLSSLDPELTKQGNAAHILAWQGAWLENFISDAPAQSVSYLVSRLLLWVVFFAWLLICWGAFRKIHGVTRWRSSAAFVLSYVALYPVGWIVIWILIGLFGPLGPSLI